MTATTASLSHLHIAVAPFHRVPHKATAITSGTSSLTAMEAASTEVPAHYTWSHSYALYAPHPQAPDASDTTT